MFQGDESTRPVAPYVSITVGDMFNDTPGYFSSIIISIIVYADLSFKKIYIKDIRYVHTKQQQNNIR